MHIEKLYAFSFRLPPALASACTPQKRAPAVYGEALGHVPLFWFYFTISCRLSQDASYVLRALARQGCRSAQKRRIRRLQRHWILLACLERQLTPGRFLPGIPPGPGR